MKKSLIIFAATAMSMGAVCAQEAPAALAPAQEQAAPRPERRTPEERANRVADQMTRKLALTPDQRNQIYAAMHNQFTQVQAAHQQAELRAKIPALRLETDEKIKTILGPEKYSVYQAQRKERGDRPRGGQRPADGDR
jgi:Spy/CpxP family protein refolding chaperone